MSCLHPLLAIYDGEHLKIINDQTKAEDIRLKYGQFFINLPCGQCIECKRAYAMEKAIRCALEAKYTTGNYFITITYDNPIYTNEEAKHDLKEFIDKVRKENPNIRYFACMERGELGDRIHGHINFFNLKIDDGYFIGCKFKSKHLMELWGHGLIDIKPFEPGMAQYTAGYTAGSTKKTICIKQSRNLGANYVLQNKYKILETNGDLYIGTHVYKMGRWGWKILAKYGSIDIKPYREAIGEKANDKMIEELRRRNLTLDDYLNIKIEEAALKKHKRKGGDCQ